MLNEIVAIRICHDCKIVHFWSTQSSTNKPFIVVVDEIEEELAPLTEALDPPPIETYDDELQKVRQAATDLSWTHIMGKILVFQFII